jgi:hypothetical protein
MTEMVRVLRPGGILLATNRTGPSARWLPGRTMKRDVFAAVLESLSLEDVRINAWQVDYDIVWARKGWSAPMRGAAQPSDAPALNPPQLLRCPKCSNGPLTNQDNRFFCDACERYYPIADDAVVELAAPIHGVA